MINLTVPPKHAICGGCGQQSRAQLIIGAIQLSICCDCLDGIESLFAAALIGPFVAPTIVIPHFYDRMPKEREHLFEAAKKKAGAL